MKEICLVSSFSDDLLQRKCLSVFQDSEIQGQVSFHKAQLRSSEAPLPEQ